MEPIICQNNAEEIIKRLQNFLKGEGIIKSIYSVEQTDSQIVMLVDKEIIDEKIAQIWWSGYSEGLKATI